MPAKSKKRKKTRTVAASLESRGSEAITVAWTVSITTLLFCNLAIVAAHYFTTRNPDAEGFTMMKELLLLSGSVLGVLSLVLLPVVYRVRTVPPPTGLAVFGACLGIAPILALVVRNLQ